MNIAKTKNGPTPAIAGHNVKNFTLAQHLQ
jgi:hypothetical protein